MELVSLGHVSSTAFLVLNILGIEAFCNCVTARHEASSCSKKVV